MGMGMGAHTDEETSNLSTTMIMMMKPYLHFTSGDILYFASWIPSSPGAFFGSCLALFVVALLERLTAALGRVKNTKWAESSLARTRGHESSTSLTSQSPLNAVKYSSSDNAGDQSQAKCEACSPIQSPQSRIAVPFVLSTELQRGVLRAGAAVLGYTLMLAVMTFNAGFIISIIIGLGIGEVFFGRFGF